MTLTKYTPNTAFQQRLLDRTGYSISNPHVRQPVLNFVAEKIKSLTPHIDARTKALLAERAQHRGRSRQFGLVIIGCLARLFGNFEYAHASIPKGSGAQIAVQPPLDPVKPDALRSFINLLLEQFDGLDWLHSPILSGLVVVLIIVQLVALRQRMVLARKLEIISQNVIDHRDLTVSKRPSYRQSEEPDNSEIDKTGIEPRSPHAETTEDQKAASSLKQPVIDEATHPEAGDLPLSVSEPKKCPTYIWSLDAVTRKGQIREENQDCFETRDFAPDLKVAIVCDGAGGIKGGREASHTATKAINRSLEDAYCQNGDLVPDDLLHALDHARQVATDSDLSGVTTALVMLLKGDLIHYATLGDGAIAVIWPDGMVGHLQVPHHTAGQPSNIINAYIGKNCQVPARAGSYRLETGSIVMAMTDGASDLFPYEDFALQRDKIIDIRGLADHLLTKLEAARDPESGAYLHHDNMTLAMARLTKGGDHE